MIDAPGTSEDAASRETLLMRGVLDMCVLAILDVAPQHAYGLVHRLHEHGFPNAGYGTIYPLVTRLGKQGLVDQQAEASPAGPARKVLQTNAAGRAALDAWVSQWEQITSHTKAVLTARQLARNGDGHAR